MPRCHAGIGGAYTETATGIMAFEGFRYPSTTTRIKHALPDSPSARVPLPVAPALSFPTISMQCDIHPAIR
jgi:hypothetical protein